MVPKKQIGLNRRDELILNALLISLLAIHISINQYRTVLAQSPTPTPDRLAEPVLPENPTQYEQGRHIYWLNCMPCHGDQGQGLTDEFRYLWEEDHQDCWGRGCHGGRMDDQGFPIPTIVPAVIATSNDGSTFGKVENLFDYLRATHPPQRPGKLTDDEYWAVTAYVFINSQRLPPDQVIGPQAETPVPENLWLIAAASALFLGVSSAAILIHGRRNALVSKND